MFRYAAILFGALYLAGCLAVPAPYNYVLQKGNAEAITRWTLQQRIHGDLINGEDALLFRAANAKSDAEAEKAIEGYLQVVRMIEGWPADTKIMMNYGSQSVTRDEEINLSFNVAAGGIGNLPENRYVREVFIRLRPDNAHPEWLRLWEAQLEMIKPRLPTETLRAMGY